MLDAVPDGAAAFGEGVELRLPLRVSGSGALVGRVCFSHAQTSGALEDFDCTAAPPAVVPALRTTAPANLHLAPGPLAWLTASPAPSVLGAPA